MRRIINVASVVLTMVVCLGVNGANAQGLDTSTNIAGFDQNEDGVRDDVVPYIKKLKLSKYKEALLFEYHAAIQGSLVSGLDRDKSLNSAIVEANLKACVYEDFTYADENLKYVNELTLNTKPRKSLYKDIRKRAPLPTGNCALVKVKKRPI